MPAYGSTWPTPLSLPDLCSNPLTFDPKTKKLIGSYKACALRAPPFRKGRGAYCSVS